MQVADVMHTDVKTADAEDTFADVAKTMRDGISSVVVLNGKLAGIVTERDIVNLVAAGGDPHTGAGGRHDARDLETITSDDLADAAERMVACNIRHLPVVDRGKVVGIVSIETSRDGRRGLQWLRDARPPSKALQRRRGRSNGARAPDSSALRPVRTRRSGVQRPSAATSRRKNSDGVQSSTPRTFRFTVALQQVVRASHEPRRNPRGAPARATPGTCRASTATRAP